MWQKKRVISNTCFYYVGTSEKMEGRILDHVAVQINNSIKEVVGKNEAITNNLENSLAGMLSKISIMNGKL